jgi:hypothetical protein
VRILDGKPRPPPDRVPFPRGSMASGATRARKSSGPMSGWTSIRSWPRGEKFVSVSIGPTPVS